MMKLEMPEKEVPLVPFIEGAGTGATMLIMEKKGKQKV